MEENYVASFIFIGLTFLVWLFWWLIWPAKLYKIYLSEEKYELTESPASERIRWSATQCPSCKKRGRLVRLKVLSKVNGQPHFVDCYRCAKEIYGCGQTLTKHYAHSDEMPRHIPVDKKKTRTTSS